jgi:hypothetical protein
MESIEPARSAGLPPILLALVTGWSVTRLPVALPLLGGVRGGRNGRRLGSAFTAGRCRSIDRRHFDVPVEALAGAS